MLLINRTILYKIFIAKTQFRNIQNSPIYLTSDESISSYISHCYFKDNYIPNPKSGILVLKNKEVSSNDFINKENHRPYFIYQGGYTCGHLIIAGCLFKNCFSGDEGGGGIFVSQHENIFIHETLFDGCHSTGFTGGCCCICGKRVQYVDINVLIDEHLPQADIQYCCFQNCYGANDITMGAALYIAAVDMNLNYTSSTNCSCLMMCRGGAI